MKEVSDVREAEVPDQVSWKPPLIPQVVDGEDGAGAGEEPAQLAEQLEVHANALAADFAQLLWRRGPEGPRVDLAGIQLVPGRAENVDGIEGFARTPLVRARRLVAPQPAELCVLLRLA